MLEVNSAGISNTRPVDMCVLCKVFTPTRNPPDFKHASQ